TDDPMTELHMRARDPDDIDGPAVDRRAVRAVVEANRQLLPLAADGDVLGDAIRLAQLFARDPANQEIHAVHDVVDGVIARFAFAIAACETVLSHEAFH